MNQRNENCESMEKKALLEKDLALKLWQKHAENCADCQARLEVIEKLKRAGTSFNESLGEYRCDAIRKAVAERSKQRIYFPILKYAALILVLMVCVFLVRSLALKSKKTISGKDNTKEIQETTEFAWDDTQNTDSLKSKIKKLKRKVYFSDLRNSRQNSFKSKCRYIRKQTYKLKNAKQI